ncbi:hypothetical protein, unknown function [Leishmania tarentolae]|uniref:Uncharacterized protein n=1 Tax=Leishmania tarentolae TaxID=5689 RepID=A0A640KLX2_LEITA|nr:hypothetical protein, unknown function [Leishmania tarentolae]GET90372.1 hypothetical protein, unknown function [Leishmania tarentolae]
MLLGEKGCSAVAVRVCQGFRPLFIGECCAFVVGWIAPRGMGSLGSTSHLQHGRDHGFSVEDPVGRFAHALEQFVWQAASPSPHNNQGMDAHLSDHLSCSLSSHRCSGTSMNFMHMTHSLQSALRAAAPCTCSPRGDSVTEAGLYLLRLTRVLEQKVLETMQQDIENSIGNETTLPLRDVQAATASRILDMEKQYLDTSTIRRRGRRYTVPETSLFLKSSAQPVDFLPTKLTRSSSPTEGETMHDLVRYHAELTLGLQQSMLWCISRLDASLVISSQEDGGVCGVLTHPRAAQLQWMFLDAVVQSVTHLQQQWRADTASTGSAEAVREASVVLDRLLQAIQELRHPSRMPQLQVCELSESGTERRSPPPFASWKPVLSAMRDFGGTNTLPYSTSPRVLTSAPESINECLGVIGADYSTKLIAQQFWCAQQLLSQRFPGYAASWEVLERARFFVESARSPTPTVPRSNSPQRVATHVAAPSPVSVVELKCKQPRSHGGSTPPCVDETQRKCERPYDLQRELSLPSRGLVFTEEKGAGVVGDASTAVTDTTASKRCLPIESPGAPPTPPLSPLLLQAARCALWDNFLASNNLSPTAILLAIQDVAAGTLSSQPEDIVQHTHSGHTTGYKGFLCEVSANSSAVKPSKKDPPRDYSSESEPGRKMIGALDSALVHGYARSS